jgi:hypothetical protein
VCFDTHFEVAYNMNEMRDQMFGLSEDLKKHVVNASPSVIDKSIQKQVEHVAPDIGLRNEMLFKASMRCQHVLHLQL